MNKLFRIALVLGMVIVVTLLAGGSMAWAGLAPRGAASVVSNAANPAGKAGGGSVKPPPAALTIRSTGSFSAGGFCLIKVESLAPGFRIVVQRSYYSGFGQPLPVPDGIFLSAVCHIQYYDDHNSKLLDLPPDFGSVQICFAAIPNRFGDIFVYTPPIWTDLETGTDDLLACSPAPLSGFYVRRGR